MKDNTEKDRLLNHPEEYLTGGGGEHGSSMHTFGQTQLEMPLSDNDGNEVSTADLQRIVGAESQPTIGVLEDMRTIGMGGIGTVFSAQDPVLHREIAIKILRPAYRNQFSYVTSFIREARITAQIDHPNVIPVHRLGVFDDAGTYFTMKRVRGITLAQLLRKLKNGDEEAVKTYTRQRLLEIFVSICNGVAFAHSKGIIHRDLKPANIMVGRYGEVFIADWGLALYREDVAEKYKSDKISLGDLPDEDQPPEQEAKPGCKISGTPAFMAPEQVLGKHSDIDEQTDVYALGTILYSILTWEQSPFEGAETVTKLMQRVISRKFLRPRRRAPRRRIPYELEAVTLKAMHGNKEKRYGTVIALLNDVRNYLAKYPVSAYSPMPHYRLYKLIRRRPLIPVTLMGALLTLGAWNASEYLHNYMESRSTQTLVQSTLDDCDQLRNAAIATRSRLNQLYTISGNTETYDKAQTLRSRYLRSANEFTIACNNAWEHLRQLLNLNTKYDVVAPLFSRLLTGQMHFANAVNNQSMLTLTVERLRHLPPELQRMICTLSPILAKQSMLLKQNMGEFQITLHDPSISVSAVKVQSSQPQGPDAAAAGETIVKLNAAPQVNTLPAGNYLITVRLPDKHELRFPVTVERDKLETVDLVIPKEFPEDMAYIPEGRFIFGDRTFDDQSAHTRLDAFFIKKTEVTTGEYLEFWKTLKSKELRERYRAYVDDLSSRGRKLVPLWNERGVIFKPYTANMPVIGLTGAAMEAYCQYMSKKTGRKYRLPTALEWEKAARGVDGREYVWGNHYQENFACINKYNQAYRGNLPVEVATFPKDCSVYGVSDLAGNARELVTNPGSEQYYTVKGGSFNYSRRFARAASNAYVTNLSDVGFRCVVEIEK